MSDPLFGAAVALTGDGNRSEPRSRNGILVAVLDDDFLGEWCDRYLGARPARVLFRSGHLSQVVGAEPADGRRVVIKAAWPVRGSPGARWSKSTWPTWVSLPEPLAVPVQAGGSQSLPKPWCRR